MFQYHTASWMWNLQHTPYVSPSWASYRASVVNNSKKKTLKRIEYMWRLTPPWQGVPSAGRRDELNVQPELLLHQRPFQHSSDFAVPPYCKGNAHVVRTQIHGSHSHQHCKICPSYIPASVCHRGTTTLVVMKHYMIYWRSHSRV